MDSPSNPCLQNLSNALVQRNLDHRSSPQKVEKPDGPPIRGSRVIPDAAGRFLQCLGSTNYYSHKSGPGCTMNV